MKKTISIIVAILAMMCVSPATAQTLVFHLPDGGLSEVTMPCTFTFSAGGDKLIIDGSGNHIELQRDRILAMTYRPNRGDSNGDMTVDVADIATIISIMSGQEDGNDPEPGPKPDEPGTAPDLGKAPQGTAAVDLGLPSGTLWANMNIGATSPQEDGLYFAWGETKGYTADISDGRRFDWANYKWMSEGQSSWQWVSKYQVADGKTEGCWYDADGNFVGDGLSTLDLTDDAAHANWGGQWVMPTYEDMRELLDNTTSEWTTLNGVKGRTFTSKTNGNAIFIPAACYRYGNLLYNQDSGGTYWSSTVDTSNSGNVYFLNFYAEDAITFNFARFYGRSVRAVLKN